MSTTNLRRRSLLAFVLLLAACGGGGGHAPSVAPPAGLAYQDPNAVLVVDVDGALAAPTWNGTVDRFTVLPALPPGLALDEQTGAIRGPATAVAGRRTYTITASNAGGSTSTALDLAVVPAPRFAYALSAADSTITIFDVDAATGRLARKGYRDPPAGDHGASQLCVHPSEAFLYVANAESESISVYAVDPLEGWLDPRASAPAGPGPHRMTLRPDGRYAYLVSRAESQLWIYTVDDLTGELALARAPLATGLHPTDVTVDPQGRFLFIAFAGTEPGGAGAGVQAYAIDALDGNVAPSGNAIALAGMAPTNLRVDPTRNAVYVTLEQTDSVLPMRYHQTTGALAALDADATGDEPEALAFDPLGRFTFVANGNGSSVSSYVVDDASGQLIPSGTTAAGTCPCAMTVDTAGRWLYVANRGSNDVMQFRVADTNGALSLVDAWAVRSEAVDFVVVRGAHAARSSTRFLHVVNAGSNDVSAFSIDPDDGRPHEHLPTSPTGAGPAAIALHPRYPFAYVAERGTRTLGAYRVDGADGALTPLGPALPQPGVPWGVALDPSGRFLYLIVRDVEVVDDGWLSTWAIDVADGTLHFLREQPVGSRPTFVGTEPNGRWLYVANIGSPSSIQTFRLDPATGLPDASAPPSPAPGVHALAFHPNGRALVAVLRTSNTLVHYMIDGATGQAIVVGGGGSGAGREPVALTFTRDGRFAYAAYLDSTMQEDGGHVALFRVGPNGALLTPGLSYQDGLHPTALALDADGRHLYATNAGTLDLSTFAIDSATGELHPLAPVPTGLDPRAIVLTTEMR